MTVPVRALRNCLILIGVGLASGVPAQNAACDTAEHRQFDFWVGEWTVLHPDGKPAGTSSITRELGGCLIHEHWFGADGFHGQSFNHFESSTRGWRQLWVDNSGRDVSTLEGRYEGDRMILAGVQNTPKGLRHTRITWSRLEPGVRQLVEFSFDGGKTWNAVFDGRYSAKERSAPTASN